MSASMVVRRISPVIFIPTFIDAICHLCVLFRRAADEELDRLDAIRRERDDDVDDALEGANEREQEDLDDYSEDEQDLPAIADRALNLEAFECPLREWIAEDRTRREIQRRFRMFLLSFYPFMEEVARWKAKYDKDDGNPLPPMPNNLKVLPPVYLPKIRYGHKYIYPYL
jgi:hypothetical protein